MAIPAVGKSQQPADAKCRGRENGDLAERVERAEVDEDDVDDVPPVAQCRSELGEVLPQVRRRRGRRDRDEQSTDEDADRGRDQAIASTDEPR